MSAGENTMLVVCETHEGAPTPLSLELLGLARGLADACGGSVLAAAFDARAAEEIAVRGADRVFVCAVDDEQYESELWVAAVERIARETHPSAVFAGHTPAGADLAPRLAFRLGSAAVTACVEIAKERGRLLFTRACYGGNVRETVSVTKTPAVATIKNGVGSVPEQRIARAEIVRVALPEISRRTRIVSRTREHSGKRLEDARVIVAGGRGLEGSEGFRMLEKLANVLGGVVGASRVPCDLGWCPHSWQIGLTGKTVAPDLYIAVGISGAGHHMAGCGNAKTIVAINTDPEAAIFREARFGIVGDYRKVVPALVSVLEARD